MIDQYRTIHNGSRTRSRLRRFLSLLACGTLLAACQGGTEIRTEGVGASESEVITSTDSFVEMKYRFAAPSVTDAQKEGYVSVDMRDLPKIKQTGKPALPVRPVSILLPFGRKVTGVEIIPGAKRDLEGRYVVEPSQKSVPLSYVGPVKATLPDPAIYDAGGSFPGVLYADVSVQTKRDYNILILTIFPVEYSPSASRLSYYESLNVRVTLAPSAERQRVNAKAASKDTTQYLMRIADNLAAIESYGRAAAREAVQQGSGRLATAADYRYVVITSATLANSAFTELVAEKQARGLSATIVTTEWIYANYSGTRPDGGEDNQTRIRNFIIDAFRTWGTEYVLLGGDRDIIPPRMLWVDSLAGEVDTMPSDLYYGCLDGTFDGDADGNYGEPTDGPNGADIDLYHDVYVGRAPVANATEVSSFVNKTLSYARTSDEYLHSAVMVGEYLGFGGAADYATESMEEIRLGSTAHDYTTVGFESSAFADFFTTHHAEVSGCAQSLPPLYDAPGYAWPKSELTNLINGGSCGYSGVHVLNHLGHANSTYCMKLYDSDLDSLTNDKYFFAYSQGCLPGSFDVADCFAEKITTMPAGAFAVIMNARYGWGEGSSTDGPSQRFNRPFWHAVLDQGLTELSKANAYSKEHFNIARLGDECMRWCYYETNLFGDPEQRLKMVGGVTHLSHRIDDDGDGESSGDGDAVVEPGETIELPVTLRSFAEGAVHNVSAILSSTDELVTITDASQSFGEIANGQSATSSDDFGFQVASACPGGHVVTFTLTITADEGSWSSSFTVEVRADPKITVAPAALAASVPVGGSTEATLTIANEGIGDLDFRLAARLAGGPPSGGGGPDTFGYTWVDSDAAGGPTFDWVELADLGTSVALSDDEFVEAPLPFAFPFYGDSKTSIFISANGLLTFGTGSSAYGNNAIPNVASPNDFIAPFWTDLNPQSGTRGTILYYSDAARGRFIVEYKGVQHYGSSDAETFEVILDATGRITFQYANVSSTTGATVGIENAAGDDGLSVVFNGPYLHDNLAVQISTLDWLSFSPTVGVVAPGQSVDVIVTASAAHLRRGEHQASIVALSNDPANPRVLVPVTLEVAGGNTPPMANAGADQNVLAGSMVTLDGTRSSDADGDSLTFTWSQVGGPVVTLSDVHAAQPTFATSGITATTLVFTLVVSDGIASSAADTVSINVNADDYRRTVVLIYGQTSVGQDLFIRGGIDHTYAQQVLGRDCTAENFACAIPILHRNLRNATTAPWKANDTFLDWYGAQPGQDTRAAGSPLDWTTNRWPPEWGPRRTVEVDGYGETPLNQWGHHYWMLDVDMDCSKTVDGWFELKSYIANGSGWEPSVAQPGAPYESGNHFARCGSINVFRRGESVPVQIAPLQ